MRSAMTIAFALVATAAGAQEQQTVNASGAVEAAQAFVESLDEVQREIAVLPFRTDERFDWAYFPTEREGISLKMLNEPQQQMALGLVRAAVSASGFETLETIRRLEIVLRDEMLNYPSVRDPEEYYLTLFGAPATQGLWGLRYEGHHISLHWTFEDGVIEASTPQFLGANPHIVPEDSSMAGVRAIGHLEDLARTFLDMLTAEQRAAAVASGEAPADILTRNDPVARPPEPQGIAYADLNADQRAQLMHLLERASEVQRPGVAEARLDAVRDAGLNEIRFVWLGSTEPGIGNKHYYRIQGPTFLFEYDNTQNNANHSHSVWRDFEGDFGRDLLQAHYDAHHRPGHGRE